MPLAEIVFDFYDRLKTVSKGYASFDYQSNWNAKIQISKSGYVIEWTTR